MKTLQEVTQALGKVLLFCGTETFNYTVGDWHNVFSFVRAHNIDSVLVKINDGTNVWYNGFQNIKSLQSIFLQNGIGFIPYGYFYGNKFGGLTEEINIVKSSLQEFGYMVMDMETEFNAQVTWAQEIASSLATHTGFLGCSTWADPQLQNWIANLNALKDTFDFFMPQEYTTYLDSTEYQLSQCGITTMIPTIYLGSDMPGNNAAKIAQDIKNRGHNSISLWYDGFAINNPSLVDTVVKMFEVTTTGTITTGIEAPAVQFSHVWNSGTLRLPVETGIGKYVKSLFYAKKISPVFPISKEIDTIDWSGKAIVLQSFSSGIHAEYYHNGTCKVYDAYGKVIQ